MRVHIQQDRIRVINRIARLLETVNLKLASVASNIVGVSGLAMLRLLAQGDHDPERLAECARGLLRVNLPALVLALEGPPDEHFRWMLSNLLRKLDWLDEERARWMHGSTNWRLLTRMCCDGLRRSPGGQDGRVFVRAMPRVRNARFSGRTSKATVT